MPSSWWLARPTRWRNVPIERGDPIWQTSSTGPTSIPSSSDAVATSARREPARSRASTIRRRSADRLPWWAATTKESVTGLLDSVVEALGELVGDPLGELPGVHENERGAVLANQLGDTVEDLAELPARGDRLELRVGQLDRDVEARVDGRSRRSRAAVRSGPTPQSSRATTSSGFWVAERPIRCRRPPVGLDEMGQPLEAEGQMAPPLVPGQRVDLVDDDRPDVREASPGTRPP